jgi:hypothetical protein
MEGQKHPTWAREKRGFEVPRHVCSEVVRGESPGNAHLMCMMQLAHTLITQCIERKEKRVPALINPLRYGNYLRKALFGLQTIV